MKYDALVMLGTQPDITTWRFPKQIYDCLDKAAHLLKEGQAPYVITSGDHSISIDNRELEQPFKECDAMADYLIKQGIQDSRILREGLSKDTPSNLYYLKTEFFVPRKMKRLLFVVADFRIPRLKFLCQRILGHEYKVEFEPVKAEVGPTYDEPNTWRIQEVFLKPMKDGDHQWLKDKFYTAPVYDYWRLHDKQN